MIFTHIYSHDGIEPVDIVVIEWSMLHEPDSSVYYFYLYAPTINFVQWTRHFFKAVIGIKNIFTISPKNMRNKKYRREEKYLDTQMRIPIYLYNHI